MKTKILITISALLLTLVIQAQGKIIDVNNNPPENYIPQKGDYIMDNKLNDFEGIYKLTNSNGFSFKLSLEKKKHCYDMTGVCYDCLLGSFELKEKSKILVSKNEISNKKELWTSEHNKSYPQIYSLGTVNDNHIQIRIKDEAKNKTLKGYIKKLGNGKYSLEINGSLEKWRGKGENKSEPGITLPSKMILTKIE